MHIKWNFVWFTWAVLAYIIRNLKYYCNAVDVGGFPNIFNLCKIKSAEATKIDAACTIRNVNRLHGGPPRVPASPSLIYSRPKLCKSRLNDHQNYYINCNGMKGDCLIATWWHKTGCRRYEILGNFTVLTAVTPFEWSLLSFWVNRKEKKMQLSNKNKRIT